MNIDPQKRVERLRHAHPRRAPDADPEGRLPPGQYLTGKFPVLTHGSPPRIDLETWRFRAFGLVESETQWTHEAFRALPQVEIKTDFHCVTRWSQLDNLWMGVHIREIVERIRIKPEARYVMVHSYGGYTTNLPLDDLLDDDVLLAHSRNGQPLSPDHGGPLRLVVPKLYAWKSAKWASGLEFMSEDKPGFWESYGYHSHGDPWQEERFA